MKKQSPPGVIKRITAVLPATVHPASPVVEKRRRQPKRFSREELTLFVLHLIDLSPAHGYGIIRTFERYSMGAYVPSPGVIYPILAQLESQGLVMVSATENGRRQCHVTAQGRAWLTGHNDLLRHVIHKMKKHVTGNTPPRHPIIEQAFEQLKFSLRSRLYQREASVEELERISTIILEASERIRQGE